MADIQTLPGMDTGHLNRASDGRVNPLMPACFLKKTVLLPDDWLKFLSQIRKQPQSLLTCLALCEQGRPILFLLLFPENQLYPLPQGFKFKPNGFNDLSPAPHPRAANPCHQI